MIEFVSSVNAKLWSQYGQRFAEEFSRHSDGSISLTFIFEAEVPQHLPQIMLPNIRLLWFDSAEHRHFIRVFGGLWEANGYKLVERLGYDGKKTLQLFFGNHRFDAVRFSFKVFAIKQFFETSVARYVTWIDADMRVLKPISQPALEAFMPDSGQLMGYLGRANCSAIPYSECGFLSFDTAHPLARQFVADVGALYTSGELFAEQEWHDSWLWDVVRKRYEMAGVDFKNLAIGVDHLAHPFINCGLGEFFDHLKGPERKQLGHSLPQDRGN